MSSPHKSPRSSNNGINTSPKKKPSLPVRFIKWTAFQMISFIFAILLLWVGYAAWQTINSSEVASGQPLTQSLMQRIVGNLDDLNSRLQAINPTGTNISTNNLCLHGNCKTSWDSGWIGTSVFNTTVNEVSNAPWDAVGWYPCWLHSAPNTYRWMNTCASRACRDRGFKAGIVQEITWTNPTDAISLTCF